MLSGSIQSDDWAMPKKEKKTKSPTVKNEQIGVRISESEREEIERRAAELNMAAPEYLRYLARIDRREQEGAKSAKPKQ